jgi:hypothetical protein
MSGSRGHGRQALWAIGLLLAGTVASVSVWFAWRYGRALGGPDFEGQLLGAAFAVLDAFKALLPGLRMGALDRGHGGLARAARCGFVGLCLLSIWAAFSVEVLERAALAAKHMTTVQQLADLEAERSRAEGRLRVLGETRPVATVDADIAAERHNWRWTTSKGCTDATARDSRAFCATYNRLFGELAAAQEAANLRARVDRLQRKIAKARSAQAPTAAELKLIGELLDFDAEVAGFIRALALAVVVELVNAFGVTLVWVNQPGCWTSRRRHGRGRRQPQPSSKASSMVMSSALSAAARPLACGAVEGVGGTSQRPFQTQVAMAARGGEKPSPTRPSNLSFESMNDSPRRERWRRRLPRALWHCCRLAKWHCEPLPSPPRTGRWLDVSSRRGVMGKRASNHSIATSTMRATRRLSTTSPRGRHPTGPGEALYSTPSPRPRAGPSCLARRHVSDFVDECLRIAGGEELAAAKLIEIYLAWCAKRGEGQFAWQIVARELGRLGFRKRKTRGVIIYRGLAIAS